MTKQTIDQTSIEPPMRIVIVGHVDHGKSTLIGRLLYDTDSLPDGKYEELQEVSKKRGDVIEWSFVLDAFQAERDQAITIDTTQIWFNTEKRPYVIIDAPGHREFLKNMVSGAAQADTAILVVDAAEGVQEQTRRHAYLLHLLGLDQILVVVNKVDTIDHDAKRFRKVADEVTAYLKEIGVTPSVIIPASARHGKMIANRGEELGWYEGPTVVEALDHFTARTALTDRPLRFPVQDVYRTEDGKRIIVGRVESGMLSRGDELLFSPTNEKAKVTTIEVWPPQAEKIAARPGEVIGITLDQKIFVERGHIASHADKPPMLSNVFRSTLFWLSPEKLRIGNTYRLRTSTFETMVSVQSIDALIDTQDLSHQSEDKGEVEKNMVARVTLRSREVMPIDPHADNPVMGRMVLYDGYDIAGGGLFSMEGYPDQRRDMSPKSQNIYEVKHLLDTDSRALLKGHNGAVFWFTGLSGAGKSTLAMAVEKALFEKHFHTYVLDGDNVRHGLNADLGFSPEDRAENIRRIGHVAALMSDAGQVVLTAFISPYRADRRRAREAAPSRFHEIYVHADLETCEARDPKGLYKKARDGQIADFTGIDSPYEAPNNPELVVDTQHNDLETCVQQVLTYIEDVVRLPTELEQMKVREKAFAG